MDWSLEKFPEFPEDGNPLTPFTNQMIRNHNALIDRSIAVRGALANLPVNEDDTITVPIVNRTGVTPTFEALMEVRAERRRQDEQWGEQNHPYRSPLSGRDGFLDLAEEWKRTNAARVDAGSLSWDGILLEEVFEALAEENKDRRIEELIQVAAVAVAMVEAIRRGGTT